MTHLLALLLLCLSLLIFQVHSTWNENMVEHVKAVNENFQKVDGSLRVINDNFKALDLKVNDVWVFAKDNRERIEVVANETQKSFKSATAYLRHFQEEVDGVKESIKLLNETLLELKNMILLSNSNECKTTST